MSYIPPFHFIEQKLRTTSANGKGRIAFSRDEFVETIKLFLRAVQVDEDWYLRQYDDVQVAVLSGTYKSAKHHFVEEGYFEGRLPSDFDVDESWYTATYGDVGDGIKTGTIRSAKDHFREHGYAEGRLPFEY